MPITDTTSRLSRHLRKDQDPTKESPTVVSEDAGSEGVSGGNTGYKTKSSKDGIGGHSAERTPGGRIHINRIREWIIPRSVVGLVSLILAFSMGASVSGVAFYAFYQYQQTQSAKKIDNYVDGFDERYRTASESIDNEKQNAQATIQQELAPLIQASGGGVTFGQMSDKVKDSVWFVQTQDEKGAPSAGTAFVVQSTEGSSLLVTSYNTVKASTASPGPSLQVTKGNDKHNARLLNWVEDQDLAVISIDRGNLPALKFAPEGQPPLQGDRIFVASGLGGAGASVSQGYVNDASAGIIQHSAPISDAFRGGPLLNSDGLIVGVASTDFAPLGFASDSGITFALPIRETCSKLLTCPTDQNRVDGARGR